MKIKPYVSVPLGKNSKPRVGIGIHTSMGNLYIPIKMPNGNVWNNKSKTSKNNK